MQRADPANGTGAKQFVDAVNGSSGKQHLNRYAARGQFLLKADCGPHAERMRWHADDQICVPQRVSGRRSRAARDGRIRCACVIGRRPRSVATWSFLGGLACCGMDDRAAPGSLIGA